jgi:outer membrane protein
MNNKLKSIAAAVALLALGSASAQSSGSWLVRGGATTISPQVSSGDLTAPSFPGTKIDVGASTQLSGGITYMLSDTLAVDFPLALPFKHKLYGAGAINGVGEIGSIQSLPITVFLQYRFFEATTKFRPYLGLGLTYAKFFNAEGNGTLTALTNPGGSATTLSVESKFVLTPQLGASYALDDRWFVDVFYSKSVLSTRSTLSTGQTIDVGLDPVAYGVSVGYRF